MDLTVGGVAGADGASRGRGGSLGPPRPPLLMGGEAFLLSLAVVRIGPVHSEPWTYVTMMFIHADLTHLLFNLLFLIFLGPMLEERIGPVPWGGLFLAGGGFATVVFELLLYQSPGDV